MNTLRLASAIAILALMLLPSLAPLLPSGFAAVAAAQTQEKPYIETSVDSYGRIISYGMLVKVKIYDPNASAEYVKANITVAGSLNKDVIFGYNTSSGYYEATLNITRIGSTETASVEVKTVLPNGTVKTRTLNGVLSEGKTVVIAYKASNGDLLTATLTYKLYELVIRNRYHEGMYWIPRLVNATLANGKNLADLYGAMDEWRISAPGYSQDNMTVLVVVKDFTTGYKTNATIVFEREAPNSIFFKPKNATEAKKITKMLVNVSEQLATLYRIKGIDFAHPQIRGDDVQVEAAILNTGQHIAAKKLAIFASDAVTVYTATAPTKPIKVTVYDADADLDAVNTTENMTAELGSTLEILKESYAVNQAQVPVLQLPLVESGNNGVFTTTIDPIALSSKLYPVVISETDNVIDWHLKDLRIDAYALEKYMQTGDPNWLFCDKFGSFTIPYHKMEFKIMESSVVIRNAQRCCPVPKITLHIEDQDSALVNPNTGKKVDVVARTTIPAGQKVYEATLYYVDPATGNPSSLPAYTISIYVNATDGKGHYKLYNVTTAKELTIALYQVASGVLEYDLDLTRLNWTQINKMVSDDGYKIYAVVVEVTDHFAVVDNKPSAYTEAKQATVQTVAIELGRTTIPVAKKLTEAGAVNPDQATVRSGDVAQLIPIKIIDNGSNLDCCKIDNISSTSVHLELIKTDKNGNRVIYVAGDGVLQIPMYQLSSDGTPQQQVATCYIEVTNLQETSANSGVFTGTIKIYTVDQTTGDIYAGCPSPWLQNAVLKVEYVSPSIGNAEAQATFKFMDASIKVVDPATGKEITSAVFGTPIKVIVEDPDANLDLGYNESVKVRYDIRTLGGISATGYLWITQTKADSDMFNGSIELPQAGIVENEVYIDMNLLATNTGRQPSDFMGCTACLWLNFTYVDETPYDPAGIAKAESLIPSLIKSGYANPATGALDWLAYLTGGCVALQEKTASVWVHPVKGKVEIYYTVNSPEVQQLIAKKTGSIWQDVTNKTGIPAINATMLKIVIVDPDRNLYYGNEGQPNGGDSMNNGVQDIPARVWIRVEGIPATVYLKQFIDDGLAIVNETEPGVFVIQNISLADLANYIAQQTGISVSDVAQLLAGKKITVGYEDYAAQCPPSPAQCSAAGALAKAYTFGVDMKGEVKVVDAVTGEAKPYYRCACPMGAGACPAGGDVVNATVEDITLLDLYIQGLNVINSVNDGNLLPNINNVFDVLTNTSAGFVNPNKLDFIETSLQLTNTSDGVYIPYVVYSAIGRIKCSGAMQQGYIIAANGENVTFIYYDPADAQGNPVEVKETIHVGAPPVQVPPNEASNVTGSNLYVLQGNKIVPTEVVKVGEPVLLKIQLQYDPNVMKNVLQQLGGAGDAFYVIYFVKYNATGELALDAANPAFGFQAVVVGQNSASITMIFNKPGTYVIQVLPVLSPSNPVPVGAPTSFTVTVSQ